MANNLNTYSDSDLQNTYKQFKDSGGTDEQVYNWAKQNNVSADALGRAGANVQGYGNYLTQDYKDHGGATDAAGAANYYGAAKNYGFNDQQIANSLNNTYKLPTGFNAQQVSQAGQGAINNLYAQNVVGAGSNDAQMRDIATKSGLSNQQFDYARQNYVNDNVGRVVNGMQSGQNYQFAGGTLTRDQYGLTFTDASGKRGQLGLGGNDGSLAPSGQTSGAGVANWLANNFSGTRDALVAAGMNPDAYNPNLQGNWNANTDSGNAGSADTYSGASGTSSGSSGATGLLPSLGLPGSTINTKNLMGGAGDYAQGQNGAFLSQTNGNALVSNQMQGLLDPNNPLMQRAMARANEAANARGLLNSSIATQSGQAAMIDAAMPIAQADAATNQSNNAASVAALNQYGLTNLNASNSMALNQQQNQFTAAQNALSRQQTADLQAQNLGFQGTQNALNRQQSQQQFDANNAFQQAQLAANNDNTHAQLLENQRQYNANAAYLQQTLGNTAATTYSNQIAGVLENRDLDATGKQNAIQHINAIWTGQGVVAAAGAPASTTITPEQVTQIAAPYQAGIDQQGLSQTAMNEFTATKGYAQQVGAVFGPTSQRQYLGDYAAIMNDQNAGVSDKLGRVHALNQQWADKLGGKA